MTNEKKPRDYKLMTISLSWEDWDKLSTLAQKELRHPRDQANYLLRKVLREIVIEKGRYEQK